MSLPTGEAKYNIYEVRFKNGRKHFFKNTENLTLYMGDSVVVEGSPGYDVGVISLSGELVKIQMKKRNVTEDSEEVKKIYRKASQNDIEIWQEAREKEPETQRKGREIISKLGLKMKLSDVEYQGDGKKAIFYYTADERVDFRQLIRDLASLLSIRIEMKQVGMRQEAGRLGGIGSCGRELCCSTWLTDFRRVNTNSARYQQLSLNPLKLAGQCGKLKCCLNYELDTYLDALKAFPKQDVVLKTEKGEAVFVKMDIFKKLVWYTYKNERSRWFMLSLEQVDEIIEINKNNQVSASLEDYQMEVEIEKKVSFEDAVGEDSLTRFDTPKKSKNKKRRRKTNNSNKSQQNNQNRNQNNQKTKNKPKVEVTQNNKKPKQNKTQNTNQNDNKNQSQNKKRPNNNRKKRPNNRNRNNQNKNAQNKQNNQ
ncbi:MAG: hypothetical protein CR961_01360 [Polaribacter sp.]|nr:MAG: hypothetical protein CR961_01360 [Polaribacter sp.]